MKSLVILTLCFALAGLAACSANKGSSTGPEIARSRTPAQPQARPSAANEKGRASSPQEEAILLKSLETAHQMFSEVWLKTWSEGRQEIESPFFALKKRLLWHQRAEGQWEKSVEECPRYSSELEVVKVVRGIRERTSGLKLSQLSCSNRDKALVAEITFKPQQIQIVMHRGHFRDGFGISLQTTGGTATCLIDLNVEYKMEKLRCQGLGQNRSSDRHVVFDQFEYSRSNEQMLLVRGSKYRGFQKECEAVEPQPCLEMMVPLSGTIKISENRITPEERAAYEKELSRIEFENGKIDYQNKQQAEAEKKGVAVAAKPGETAARPATPEKKAAKPLTEQDLRERLGLRPEEPLPAEAEEFLIQQEERLAREKVQEQQQKQNPQQPGAAKTQGEGQVLEDEESLTREPQRGDGIR